MSAIAVRVYRDRIEVAADSICTSSEQTMINDAERKCSKLFRHKDILVGGAGRSAEIGLLRRYMKDHELQDLNEDSILEFLIGFMKQKSNIPNDDGKIHNRYIFASAGKCYSTCDLFVFKVDDYYAIGAGDDFARGALYMGASPKEAVRAACHMCVYATEPIQVESI